MFGNWRQKLQRRASYFFAFILLAEMLAPVTALAQMGGGQIPGEDADPAGLTSQQLTPNAIGGFSKIVIPGQGVSASPLDQEQEIISRRDAYNSVWLQPDGSYRQRRYTTPHFYQVPGGWDPIDTTLKAETEGGVTVYKTTANDWEARIASSNASLGMVRLKKGNLNITVRPVGASIVAPQIQTNSNGDQIVHYADLWPNVDVNYQILGSEIKEWLVLKNNAAPTSYQFAIEGVQLTPHPTIAGAFAIVGNSEFMLAPVSLDSEKYGPITEPVISQAYSNGQLTVTLQSAWLAAQPADAFPIAIDPTWRKVIGINYTNYKSDGYVCDYNYNNCPALYVGTIQHEEGGWYDWRTVFKVDYDDIFTAGRTFVDAKLYLEMQASGGITAGRWIDVDHAACYGFDCINGSLHGDSQIIGTSGWLDVSNIYANRIAAGDWGAALIISGEEINSTSLKRFNRDRSWVDFEYDDTPPPNDPPPASTLASPTNGVTVNTLQPTLVTNPVTDPNGDAVIYNFHVCMSPDCSDSVIELDNSPFNQFTVSEGVLQDGTTYYWRSYTRDIYHDWSPSSMIWSFRVDLRNGKDSTQSYDSAGPVSVDLATGNLTTSLGSHGLKALGGNIGIGLEYNSPARTRGGLMASYWDGTSFDGDPLLRRVEEKVDFDWGLNSPDNELFRQGYFSSSFDGYFIAPQAGTYYFGVSSDDDYELIIDGQTIVASSGCCADKVYGAGTALQIGQIATVRFRHIDRGGPAVAKLWVKGAVQETIVPTMWLRTAAQPLFQKQGVTARYYRDDGSHTFSENRFLLSRREQIVNNNWRSSGPLVGVTDQFLAKYTTYFTAPIAGSYAFGAGTDDGAKLTVNGVLQINEWVDRGYARTYGTPVTLSANQSIPIILEYFENAGDAVAKLWVKGDVGEQIIPAKWMSPTAQILPNGWELSMDGDGNLAYERAQINQSSVVLYDSSGSNHEYKWDLAKNAYVPPVNESGTLTRNSDSTLFLSDTDGRSYLFGAEGQLLEVTTTTDYKSPASLKFEYAGTPSKLTKIIDGVDPTRYGRLYYGADAACTSVPTGFDATAPATMICAFGTTNNQTTRFYYKSGQLARVVLPGGETTDFSYDSEGRLMQERGSVAFDAVKYAFRPDDATVTTQIGYDIIGRASAVTMPAPTTGAFRAVHNYRYFTNSTQTSETGETEPFGFSQWIYYDSSLRTVKVTDKANLDSWTQWEATKDLVRSTTDPTDLKSTTVYDQSDRPIDSYGPAPASWFDDQYPTGPNASNTPHVTTAYDELIQGFGVTYHDYLSGAKVLRGSPKFYSTGISNDATGNPARNWGQTVPFTVSGDAQGWGLRATGRVTFPQTGDYTFLANSDGGVKVYVDDKLIINDWNDGVARDHPSAVFNNPTAGKSYRIRLEYYHKTGDPNTVLYLNLSGPGLGGGTGWGNILKPDYGLTTSTMVFDAANGNVTTRTDYGANPELGLVQSVKEDADGLNLTTSYTYETPGTNKFFRQLSKTLPGGTTTNYSYYTATESRDNPCTVPVDAARQGGLMKSKTDTDPDGAGSQTARVTETVYNAAGDPVATRLNNDAWTCTTYDTRGRILTTSIPALNGAPARTITNVWAIGNNPLKTSSADASGTITVETDLLGRTTKYTDASGNVTTTVYDTAGRVTSRSGPLGAETYTYDDYDRLITQKLGTVTYATVTYDSFGRIARVDYNNAGILKLETVGRDSLQRLTGLNYRVTDGGQNVLVADGVTRAVTGDVMSQTTAGQTNSYTYDKAGRLTNANMGGSIYQYQFGAPNSSTCNQASANLNAQKNSNRTKLIVAGVTTEYCYDQADRLIHSTDDTVSDTTYDAHGNTVTLGVVGSPSWQDHHYTFTYDSSDRNIVIEQNQNRVDYIRDVQNRLTERKVKIASQPDQVTKPGYTGSGDAPDFVKDVFGTVTEKYLTLPGNAIATIRPQESGAAQKTYSLPNIHGDVMMTADAAGTKIAVHRTGPFGEEIVGVANPNNTASHSTYGYVGQHQKLTETEFASNIIQMGARLYMPILGRFLAVDPVEGGVDNNYVYPLDPVNDFDLDGTMGFRGWLKAITTAADWASNIPGPIGMIASGVAVVGYAAQGNPKAAAWAAVGLLGIGAGATIAVRVARGSKEFKSTLSLGRKAHKMFQAKFGLREASLDTFGRADGLRNRIAYELKPHNARAIKAGRAQLARYMNSPQVSGGQLWTYRKNWYGGFRFKRIY